jgi:hypothetical protein
MSCAMQKDGAMDEHELPPRARALLDAMKRADDPTAAERAHSDAALRAALGRAGVRGLPSLQPSAVGSGGQARGTFAQRTALAVKLGAGAIVIAAAAYFGIRATQPGSPVPGRSQPSAAAEVSRNSHSLARETSNEAQPAAAPPAAAPSRPVAEQPVVSHERRVPATAARKPEPRRQAGMADNALEAELRTVAAANELLRHERFRDALHLLDRTESDAAAVLREERSALRILAHCGLAPDERARRERELFLASSPRSVLADRVRSACARTPAELP